MTKKKFLFMPLLVALVFILTGCGRKTDQVQQGTQNKNLEVVKLGFIGPLSGDVGVYGEELQKVIEYYLPIINEQAEAKGKKFEVIYEDGKCAGPESAIAFQKLVDVNNVQFIIGGFCSSETLAMVPLTKVSNKVLTLSPGSSNPAINKASPFTYSFSYSDDATGKMLASVMSKYKKVAIITEQNDYNIGIKKVWSEEIKQYPELTVVADETFPKGATDFRTVLEKVKKTQPEAILLNPNAGITAENLIKQVGEMKDWTNRQLFGHYSYSSSKTLQAAPAVSENMVIVDVPQLVDPQFVDLQQKIIMTKGSLDNLGSYFVGSTLDILKTVTSLILELGSNPQVVRDALASRTFNGYIGTIYFGTNNFPDIKAATYIVKGGKSELQK